MTDLSDLKPKSSTLDVILKHPVSEETLFNEDKSEMSITVYLPHSPEYKAVQHELTNRRLKKKKVDITAEELEEFTYEVLAKTTKGWDITYGGEKPKFSVEKAKEVYSEVFWIKDQIEEAVAEHQDFT